MGGWSLACGDRMGWLPAYPGLWMMITSRNSPSQLSTHNHQQVFSRRLALYNTGTRWQEETDMTRVCTLAPHTGSVQQGPTSVNYIPIPKMLSLRCTLFLRGKGYGTFGIRLLTMRKFITDPIKTIF